MAGKSVMAAKTPLTLRLWRLRPWSSNPLMRTSDRWESVLRLLVVVVALLMIPIAGAAGTIAYGGATTRIGAERAAKVHISATAQADAVQTVAPGPYRAARYQVPVRWVRDGTESTVVLTLDEPVKAGAAVPLWIGADGKRTDPPPGPEAAAYEGIGTGLLVLGLTLALALFALSGLDALLARLHGARWEAEWRTVARPIGT
ncbi:Rv1733c family protein [Nocardia seriolae]|uniref:Uncharacterized protein n=1 Tax=Nocardia seriolae TaxID=37332 RepID=A0A0B8N7K5_9NOCA|nr:hypothetical protein [Nocardia seriolae]APA98378.1 hypothetical protein NS506_04330 [Nocardia seriolae]MTJ64150.1 hypothetical protein [Nocardia seriolae]MTJ72916.1 hypothetical protein [Nocardia seriolae]MTJ88072.1 hypothetical protein [Nocardia seriolae]MTK32062.1 hypothetical protein [Nocardia seriolae]